MKLNKEITESIFRKRDLLRLHQVGQTVRFHVAGRGNMIPVTRKDGSQVFDAATGTIPLMKSIYNTSANSELALKNKRNLDILKGAEEAERDGDFDAASAAYNDFLNKIQVSFNVMHNPGRTPVQFYDKQLVEGEVELITTENGQMLTVTNVRAVAVEKLDKMPAITLSSLLDLGNEAPKAEDIFQADGAAKDAKVGA